MTRKTKRTEGIFYWRATKKHLWATENLLKNLEEDLKTKGMSQRVSFGALCRNWIEQTDEFKAL